MKIKKITKLLIISIIAIIIIIYVSVSLSKEGFQTIDPTNYPGGTLIGFRVKNSLAEISKFLIDTFNDGSSSIVGMSINDCMGNTLWTLTSPPPALSTSNTPGIYLIKPSGRGIMNPGTNIVTEFNSQSQNAASIGINLASLVLSNYEYPLPLCSTNYGGVGSSNPMVVSGVVNTLQNVSSTVGGVTGQTTLDSSSPSQQLSNTLNLVFTPQVSAQILEMLRMFFYEGNSVLQS